MTTRSRSLGFGLASLVFVGGNALAAPPASVDPAVTRAWKAKCASCHGEAGDPRGKPQGEKMKVESMATAGWQKAHSDAQIEKGIVEGVKGEKDGVKQEMKAFKDLPADQVKGLVALVRSFGPAPAAKPAETKPAPAEAPKPEAKPAETKPAPAEARPEAKPAAPDPRAAALFKKSCASCHGADGKATTGQGKKLGIRDLTDPAFQATFDEAKVKELLTKGGEVKGGGKAMKHPVPKAKPDEIRALAAYVKSLKK